MDSVRVFVSFDADNDEDLKNLLVGQAKNEDSPFWISDWSVKEPFPGDWKEKVREKLRKVEVVCVICGEDTNSASGVRAELSISQDENIPYFLLYGRADKSCKKPTSAKESDKVYKWTWDNLKLLIHGNR